MSPPQPWRKLQRERIRSKSKWWGFYQLSQERGSGVGRGTCAPLFSLSSTVPSAHPLHCTHGPWHKLRPQFSVFWNHVVSCLICPQALSLLCSKSLLFSLYQWWLSSKPLCVQAGGVHFFTVPFLPRHTPAPQNTVPSSAASKALRNLQESLLLSARKSETSEKSHPCLTKLLVAPC